MDIDPEKRTGLLEQAALGGTETINGVDLRPVTSATWSLLARLGNPFVVGGENTDYAFAVYSFVYLHSKPIAEIRKHIATIDELRAQVYDFMDSQPPAQMFSFMPWITSQVETVAATITQAAGATAPDSPKA